MECCHGVAVKLVVEIQPLRRSEFGQSAGFGLSGCQETGTNLSAARTLHTGMDTTVGVSRQSQTVLIHLDLVRHETVKGMPGRQALVACECMFELSRAPSASADLHSSAAPETLR